MLSAHAAFVRPAALWEGETDFDLFQMTLSGCFQGEMRLFYGVLSFENNQPWDVSGFTWL